MLASISGGCSVQGFNLNTPPVAELLNLVLPHMCLHCSILEWRKGGQVNEYEPFSLQNLAMHDVPCLLDAASVSSKCQPVQGQTLKISKHYYRQYN